MDITLFERALNEFIDQINKGLDGLAETGIKVLDSEFYLPDHIPEIYIERVEMIQEKLDAITKRLKNE